MSQQPRLASSIPMSVEQKLKVDEVMGKNERKCN